jgi:peptidoglycan hydrolase CwlO-like protein
MKYEIKKREVEIMKVEAAKADYELKIMERHEDIERLKGSIDIQDKRVLQLKAEIEELTRKIKK